VSPEAQRIAIAEYRGWKSWPAVKINGIIHEVETWVAPCYVSDFHPETPHAGCVAGTRPPDYLRDLNAIREVIAGLPEREVFEVTSEVYKVCNRDGTWIILVTARQLSEAFLRTLGLWKEDA
jgi:hypothetical protein